MKSLRFIPFYLLWIISSSVSIMCGFIWRAAITSLAAVIVAQVPIEWQIESQWYLRWVVSGLDPIAVAFLTILVFISITVFDYLYRAAIEKKTVRKTFGLVTSIQAGILVVGVILITISAGIASVQ